MSAAFRVAFGELATSQNNSFSGRSSGTTSQTKKKFKFGGKKFVVVGGTSTDRTSVKSDVIDDLGTPRGQLMLTELNSRRRFGIFKRKFTIDLNVTNNAFVKVKDRNTIFVDPNLHPLTLTTAGLIPATTRRIIAHEFGHATFKVGDTGVERLKNVNENENPIMNSLGQPSRTRY